MITSACDLTLGGFVELMGWLRVRISPNGLERWIIFYKKRHNPLFRCGKISDPNVRWRRGVKEKVFVDGNAAWITSGLRVPVKPLCWVLRGLQGEEVNPPASVSGWRGCIWSVFILFASEHQKWPNSGEAWNHTTWRVAKWTGGSGSFCIFAFTVSSRLCTASPRNVWLIRTHPLKQYWMKSLNRYGIPS